MAIGKWYGAGSNDGQLKNNGWLSNMFGSLLNRVTGAALTGSEREANSFSAEQAQISRDWQEEQYLKYNSPQSLVDQYQQAGLNPALMYGGSTPSMDTSTSSPSSVTPSPSNGILGLLQSLIGLQTAKADIKVKESQANLNNVEAGATEALTPQRIAEIASNIDLNKHQVTYFDAQRDMALANAALASENKEYVSKYYEIEASLKEAQTAETWSAREEIYQRIDNLKREFVESFAREAMYRANAGVLTQQEKNLYEEMQLIQFDQKIKKYQVEHLDADRIWNRIETGAGILRDAGIGVGAAMNLINPLSKVRPIGYGK